MCTQATLSHFLVNSTEKYSSKSGHFVCTSVACFWSGESEEQFLIKACWHIGLLGAVEGSIFISTTLDAFTGNQLKSIFFFPFLFGLPALSHPCLTHLKSKYGIYSVLINDAHWGGCAVCVHSNVTGPLPSSCAVCEHKGQKGKRWPFVAQWEELKRNNVIVIWRHWDTDGTGLEQMWCGIAGEEAGDEH